jgi:tetratricopeptide (TPR) repeat protein
MITEQLHALHGKRLDAAQTRQVCRSPQTANPLFLKTFLEELRVLGSFERLDEMIGQYLAAENTGELVGRILERCETDYDPDGHGHVAAAITAIWASSRGLAESEILTVGEIAQAFWSPLRMALQESLISYSGLIDFAHDEISDAVAARYLPTPDERRAVHRRLARFFASQEPDGRTAAELLHQLDAAEDWEGLADALRDLPVLAEAWEIAKPELWRHWEHVTSATGLTLVDAYADLVARPADFDHDHVWAVAGLLSTMRQPEAAVPLQRRLIDEARAGGNEVRLQAALGNLGLSMFLSGEYDEALACHAEEETICRSLEAGAELEMCLANKANALIALERWDEARQVLDEAADLCRRQGDTQQLGRRLAALAQLLHKQGDLLAAEAALREAVPILEAGRDHIALEAGVQRLNDLGVALKNAERYDLSEACYLNAERLARTLDRPSLVALAMVNRGVVLARMQRTDEAILLLEEAEAIARGAGDPDVLMRCLFNRAGRLVEAGRASEILPLLEEAMQLARETGQTELLPHMEAMAADARSHLW